MNNRPKDPKTARNKNVLVIGGSGSGKTRFFVKPNLMQCVSKDYPTSFVITDPKGSLIGEVGQLDVYKRQKPAWPASLWTTATPRPRRCPVFSIPSARTSTTAAWRWRPNYKQEGRP